MLLAQTLLEINILTEKSLMRDREVQDARVQQLHP